MSDSKKGDPPALRPIRQIADRLGVSVRTIHRWADSGIIDPLERINGRNYLPGDAEPRRDGSPEAV
jgi:DNA-binding transcriptional MerR regulator